MVKNIELKAQQKNVLPMTMKTASGSTVVIPPDVIRTVDKLPENPEAGMFVGLNNDSPVSWDNVKIWSRDELRTSDGIDFSKGIPVKNVKINKFPEKISFDWMEENKKYMSALVITNSALEEHGQTVMFLFSNSMMLENTPMLAITDNNKMFYYLKAGTLFDGFNADEDGWYCYSDDSITKATDEDLSSFVQDVSSPIICDYFAAVDDETYEEMLSTPNAEVSPQIIINNLIGEFVKVTERKGIYLAEEVNGKTEWTMISGDNSITETALSLAREASERAYEADDKATNAQNTANSVKSTVQGIQANMTNAASLANAANITAQEAKSVAANVESSLSAALFAASIARESANNAVKRAEEGYLLAENANEAAVNVQALANELATNKMDKIAVTESDEGKFLRVVNGEIVLDALPMWQGGSY